MRDEGNHRNEGDGAASGPTSPEGGAADGPKRARHRLRWASLAVVLLGLGAAGLFTWKQVKPVIDARRYSKVAYEVPKAPELTPADGETVYRIDPTQSSLTYEVDEKLAGQSAGTAKGVTNGIAGDLAVNAGDLAASRVGKVVANVEQFHSDNNLRDARIRQDFLESNRHPLATFEIDSIDGLSGKLEHGKSYEFTMSGNVVVKDTPATATWDVTAQVDADGTLTATATTEAKLSRFDAGPISIAGLVSTSDDVTLTLDLTAVDPGRHAVPTRITGPDAVETSTADSPSFGETVRPIIEDNCASCHTPDQMAARHLEFATAGDVAEVSDGIKTVTQAGYMPPWPASDEGVPLAHVPTLSQEDLDALAAWSDAGGPLDVDRSTKIRLPEKAAGLLPRKDQKAMMAEPYRGSPTNPNDYRCFVLDVDIDEPTFLTGYTFEPDQVQQLHHAQVFHISDEQRASAREVEGADGKPGWQCYSGPDLEGRRPDRVPGEPRKRDAGFAGQSNLVAGWVPGQTPVIFPEESGVLLQPGDALVLQLHYHYAAEPVADRSGLSLQLDADDGSVSRLRVVNPLAPVEIPCAPEDQDQPMCDRETALAEYVELYGPSGAGNEAGLLAVCGKTPEELTADFDGSVARSSCLTRVPEDGVIISTMGHMHTLGKSFRLTLDPDTDQEQILLDIPVWNFDWQMNYGLEEPLRVEAGQPLLIECSWDRAIDPERPPAYIVFAEGTEEEMCFGTYSLIPDDQ